MSEGIKYDKGKIRYNLIPVSPLRELGRTYTFGANKYAANNWQKLDNFEDRYLSALVRHLEARRSGQIINKEDGNLFHMAQVAFCAFAILWMDIKNLKEMAKQKKASIKKYDPKTHKFKPLKFLRVQEGLKVDLRC